MTDSYFLLCGIWVICGLIAMSIYQKKGRSGTTGFLGGFLLGPIGILLALASGTDKSALAQREKQEAAEKIKAGELKKCPHCAELIKSEAKVCRFCGRDVETPKAA